MPAHVRDWVVDELGSPVVAADDQVGGMSPGCATRLVCEDGTRGFVKAVGFELNPRTPILFRREITALTLVGSHELWADLLASYDDGDWVAVLLEHVEGRHPDLDDDATMDLLLRETERFGRVLGERVPDPPAPDPANGGLADLRRQFHDWADAVARAGEIPPELLPDWVRRDTATWEPLVRGLADHEVRVAHFDIRSDNLLERPTGELVFLDWGLTSLGPGWVDPLLARLERV
jgi:aminoglycoside phosphotransferase (APT) family kinase protein